MQMRSWLLALVACSGLALAGDAAMRSIDLDGIGPALGDASSGQPDPAQLETLAANGYVAVIDLRGPDEDRGFDEAEAAAAVGLEYSALPISGAAAVNVENARKLGELLEQFDGPVLVHCASGNRVGALVALLAADEGATRDDALEAGRAAGLTRLEGVVEKELDAEDAP